VIILIRSAVGPRTAVGRFEYARGIDVGLPLPHALNGFTVWVALMIGLTVVNYGYPIAQHFFLKQTAVPAEMVAR
jgi:cytochrome c oxidase subunit 1